MRGLILALLGFACADAVSAAAPVRGVAPAQIAFDGDLRAIAGWLRLHGAEGHIGGDVAGAMGIALADGASTVPAWQRGFKSDAVLRIAQIPADGERDFMLFMVQQPDDQVYFYLATPFGGLQKALVSIPSKNLVLPLSRAEAEPRWRAEVQYWKDRSETR